MPRDSRRESLVSVLDRFSVAWSNGSNALLSLWEEMGVADDVLIERLDSAYAHMNKLIEKMVLEETELRNRLVAECGELRTGIMQWREKLGMSEFDFSKTAGMALLQAENVLRAEYKRLKVSAEESQKSRDELINRNRLLCELVGIAPHELESDFGDMEKCPTETQLSALRAHTKRAGEILEQRQNKFAELQEKVRNALRFLRTQPRTQVETTVLRGCVNHERTANNEGPLYRLDDKSMQQLEALVNALERECDDYRAWVQSQVVPLWEQLESWWDKCHTPQEERARLHKADPEDYKPELIDVYKSELRRLRQVYQERVDVYEAYEKWLSLWKERLEFEARANDPDRYRSRTLQQEILREQEVSRKLLPAAHDALERAVLVWQEKHAEPILIDGLDPMAAIEATVAKHEDEKVMARQLRTRIAGTPSKTLRAKPPSPTKALCAKPSSPSKTLCAKPPSPSRALRMKPPSPSKTLRARPPSPVRLLRFG